MNRIQFWLIVFLAVSGAVGCGFLIYYKFIISETVVYDMSITVGTALGVNVDTDAIYFGETRPGNGVIKKLLIKNNKYERKVQIVAEGNISEFLRYEQMIDLKPGEEMEYIITAQVPKYIPLGYYDGTLKMYFYR